MSVRADVATAVNTAAIPGVTGVEWAPPARTAGMVWAQWARSTPHQKLGVCVGFEEEWDVILTLPATDQASTATARDQWCHPVMVAVSPLGLLGDANPTGVIVDDGGASIPAVTLKLTVRTTT